MASSPFDIIVGSADVYVAPIGEAFPAVNAAPAGNWVSLGRTEGGVTVTYSQDVKEIEVDQALLPVKTIRTKAGMKVEFQLAEITLERFAKALELAVVDTPPGPGTIGTRAVTLGAASAITGYALLIRGPSPYGDWNMQWELPKVAQTGEVKMQYVKDDKMVLPTAWTVMEDPNNPNQFGTLRAQDAAAL